jgi:peptidoglycan lytic transglycosylase G
MNRALLLLLAMLIAGSLAARYAFDLLLERPGSPLAAPIRIDVAVGEPMRTTARKLQSAGLVPSAAALTLWARWKGVDRQIRHGAYQFTKALPPLALLEKMRTGEAMAIRVTLPEGGTSRELALLLERADLGDARRYLELMRDSTFAHSLGISADGLEGYLFPDTYFFSPLDRPESILETFVGGFHKAFTPDMIAEAERQRLTTHQVVTLASVVEKESGRDAERPLVSAVFRNRLRLGMPLQADPTVIYGIDDFDGNLTRKDLETPTPYNTYTQAGLPPGPIANPGRSALLAALHPADVPYLYFVAREDGSHEFNTTLANHNRAVNRYQRARGAHAGQG